jgi:ubiquinone/menaquinone biosynthesis C-methylase UbiE
MKRAPVAVNEREWWDRYGDLHERLWNYDAYLTQRVRVPYLAEMEAYLFNPGQRLLEFGCGTGWVGLRVAQNAMALDGVDISAEQISRAQQHAHTLGVTQARFIHGGVDAIPADGNYASVILHSLLHHLSEPQIVALFARLAEVMLPGGRIYAYEPLAASPAPPLGAWLVDKLILLGLRALRTAVFLLHLQDPSVRRAVQSGWTMKSPEEAPITVENLNRCLPDTLRITEVCYLHMCAVAYANVCMELRPAWRAIFSRWIGVFVMLDTLLFRSPWRFYLQAWPMVGIKIEKTI